MQIPVSSYEAIFFDCDGVLLDANPIKSGAYFKVALPYGEEIARRFCAHHRATAGISRYVKLRALITEFLQREPMPGEVETLAESFGAICREELKSCPVCPGVRDFLAALPRHIPLFVASGGKEEEVADALETHGLAQFFTGIYGSPRDKLQIVSETQARFGLGRRCLFLGDSQYDFEVAQTFGFDFVFLWGKSEFRNWREFFADKPVRIVQDYTTLLCAGAPAT